METLQFLWSLEDGIVDVMMNTNATLLTPERGKEILEAGIDKLFISFDAVSPDLYEKQRVGTTIGKVIDNMWEFIKMRNEISPKTQIRVSMVMHPGEMWEEQAIAMTTMWKRLVDAVGYDVYHERDESKKRAQAEKNPHFHCEQLFQRMFLKYNGNITICCADDKDQYIVGNWKNDDLKEVWTNTRYKYVRDKHVQGNYDHVGMCKNCYMVNLG